MIERINDSDDPRIALYRGTPDPDLLRAFNLFVAEGRLVVRRLLTVSPYRARSVLATEAAFRSIEDVVGDTAVYLTSQQLMNQIGGFNFHRGCLALGERPAETAVVDLLKSRPPPAQSLLVILDGVGNADNVGAVFRNAAAFGARAVIVGPGSCDPLYRKAIRTSMGSALVVPFARVRDWLADLRQVKEIGYTLLALTPRPDATDIARFVESPGRARHLALLVGSEGGGLSAEALDAADLHVRIAIAPEIDSLNVATATGIALHRLSAIR